MGIGHRNLLIIPPQTTETCVISLLCTVHSPVKLVGIGFPMVIMGRPIGDNGRP